MIEVPRRMQTMVKEFTPTLADDLKKIPEIIQEKSELGTPSKKSNLTNSRFSSLQTKFRSMKAVTLRTDLKLKAIEVKIDALSQSQNML